MQSHEYIQYIYYLLPFLPYVPVSIMSTPVSAVGFWGAPSPMAGSLDLAYMAGEPPGRQHPANFLAISSGCRYNHNGTYVGCLIVLN